MMLQYNYDVQPTNSELKCYLKEEVFNVVETA